MSVHLEPIVLVARAYGEGKSYEARDAYEAVCTVERQGGEAFIVGLHGIVTRDHWRSLIEQLAALGVRRLTAERHGERATLWEVDKQTNSPEQ